MGHLLQIECKAYQIKLLIYQIWYTGKKRGKSDL